MKCKSVFLASRAILRLTTVAATLMVTAPVAATPVLGQGIGASNAQLGQSMDDRLVSEGSGVAIGNFAFAIPPEPGEQGEDADDQAGEGDGDHQGIDIEDPDGLDNGDQGEDGPDTIA